MNELTIAVSGWVATDPTLRIGAGGTTMVTFRVASTARYFDRDKREWVDSKTEWFTVRVFRGGAITVKESIVKGQPVVVTGRLRTNEWESQSGPRTDLVIDAAAVGHDVTRGIARFTRATGDAALDPSATAPVPDAGDTSARDTPAVAEEDSADSLEMPVVDDDGYAPLGLDNGPDEEAEVDEDELETAASR